jgi:hypothetical protein
MHVLTLSISLLFNMEPDREAGLFLDNLVSPEIGTDADGGSVRGAAIFPDTDMADALSH